jgi:hypothetical protein
MHKGRNYRSIVPWMALRNWLDDTKVPNRFFIGTLFGYSGQFIENFPPVMSEPALRNLKTLEYEWAFKFTAGFFDFTGRVNIRPRLTSPNNLIALLLADAFASTLLVEWEILPDVISWPLGAHIIQAPRQIAATGFFDAVPPILNLDIVHYHNEP